MKGVVGGVVTVAIASYFAHKYAGPEWLFVAGMAAQFLADIVSNALNKTGDFA